MTRWDNFNMQEMIINFSGHGEHKIIVRNMASASEIKKEAWRLLNIIINDKELRKMAELGKQYYIIPPGLSQLACTFVALYHGFFGHFPIVKWFVRTSDGFKTSYQSLDLTSLRYEARKVRASDYSKEIQSKIDQLEKQYQQWEQNSEKLMYLED